MPVHAAKYKTEDKFKTDTLQLNTTQKKQTTQNTAKQNYPGLVASYDIRPGNKVGLCYKALEPTKHPTEERLLLTCHQCRNRKVSRRLVS